MLLLQLDKQSSKQTMFNFVSFGAFPEAQEFSALLMESPQDSLHFWKGRYTTELIRLHTPE